MKTLTLFTLILSLTLIVIGTSPFFHFIGTFGIILSIILFVDIFYFQNKSKKSY